VIDRTFYYDDHYLLVEKLIEDRTSISVGEFRALRAELLEKEPKLTDPAEKLAQALLDLGYENDAIEASRKSEALVRYYRGQ